MFGIELSTGTKLQIAFVLVILGAAGFMLLRNSKKPLNDAVNSWVTVEKHYAAGSNNTKWDPLLEETVNTFTCADGKLQIIEYKNDPSRKPTIKWLIDSRRTEFLYYRDPMSHVSGIKDPYKHAIALASYSAANGASLGFMGGAALTADQLAAEKTARELMNDELGLIKSQVENGTFKTTFFDKVMQVLAEYKRVKGNPVSDSTKAEAARKVIMTANDYLNMIDDERSKTIEKYISKINGILTPDQKQKVASAGKAYEDAKNPKLAGTVRRVAPAVPAANGRGGAATGPTRVVQPTPGPTRTVTPRGGGATGPARVAPAAPARVAPPSPAPAGENPLNLRDQPR